MSVVVKDLLIVLFSYEFYYSLYRMILLPSALVLYVYCAL